MNDPHRKGARLVAIGMMGLLLLNYPFLAVFNVPSRVFGIPVVYAYLFATWSALILAMALVADSREKTPGVR